MKLLIFLYLLFTSIITYSQTCEQFDRRLFHFLPEYVPDIVNCKDSYGKKQGWWIYYKVNYNPTPIPDALDSGNYVGSYRYGKYKDDKMIGIWIKFQNIHQCYEEHRDSFYYKQDTVGVHTFSFAGYNQTVVEYIHDSTIIKAKSIEKNDTVCIYCSKKKGCKMMHFNKTIKEFSFADFDTNFLSAFDQIRNINESSRFAPNKR